MPSAAQQATNATATDGRTTDEAGPDSEALARKRRATRLRALAESTREILVERFPDTFMAKGQPKRPLKVGIYADLRAAAPDLSASKITLALNDYCTGPKYLDSLVAGAGRMDLRGSVAGVVTAVEAEAAARRALGIRSTWKVERALRDLRKAGLQIWPAGVAIPTDVPDDHQVKLVVSTGVLRQFASALEAANV
jgi:hypothetical protein